MTEIGHALIAVREAIEALNSALNQLETAVDGPSEGGDQSLEMRALSLLHDANWTQRQLVKLLGSSSGGVAESTLMAEMGLEVKSLGGVKAGLTRRIRKALRLGVKDEVFRYKPLGENDYLMYFASEDIQQLLRIAAREIEDVEV